MRKTIHRAVAAACLAALLSTLAPLATYAAPSDPGKAGIDVQLEVWLDWIGRFWNAAAPSSSLTSPNMDPDGASASPPSFELLNPDGTTTQQATSDGETSPNMDPNG